MSLSQVIFVCNETRIFLLSSRNDGRFTTVESVILLTKLPILPCASNMCHSSSEIFNISACKRFRMFPYCRQFETFTIFLCAVLLFVCNWLSCFVRCRTYVQRPATLSSTSTEAKFRFTVIVVSTFLTSFKTGKESS
jgi:hypothetical protein